MNTPQDGGPAFPVHATHALFNGNVVAVHEQGMSMRDWFAGQALMGLCANPEVPKEHCDAPDLVAGAAYECADAMLAAREGGTEPASKTS